MAKNGACCRVGRSVRVERRMLGWTGAVAHPDAPAGSGGPGYFNTGEGAFNGAENGADADASKLDSTPKEPNPPPATVARTIPEGALSVQTDFVDVEIETKVLADKANGVDQGALTVFETPKVENGFYLSDENDIVTKAKNKLKWRGTIEIQVRYAKGVTADGLACYGRGTTKTDIANGDITLGFHESCHIEHMVAYLKAHPLPKPPELKAGMTLDDCKTKGQAYIDTVEEYANKVRADTEKVVDQVGHTLSSVESSGECYEHELPPLEE